MSKYKNVANVTLNGEEVEFYITNKNRVEEAADWLSHAVRQGATIELLEESLDMSEGQRKSAVEDWRELINTNSFLQGAYEDVCEELDQLEEDYLLLDEVNMGIQGVAFEYKDRARSWEVAATTGIMGCVTLCALLAYTVL